jgi:hypothetical protein
MKTIQQKPAEHTFMLVIINLTFRRLCKTVLLVVFGLVAKIKSSHPPAGGCCGLLFPPALNKTKITSLSKPFFT